MSENAIKTHRLLIEAPCGTCHGDTVVETRRGDVPCPDCSGGIVLVAPGEGADVDHISTAAPLCAVCGCRDWSNDYRNGNDAADGYACPDHMTTV